MALTMLHVWKAQSIAKCTSIVHCEFTEYNFANLILKQMSETIPPYRQKYFELLGGAITSLMACLKQLNLYSKNALFQQLGIILNTHILPTGSLLELLSYGIFQISSQRTAAEECTESCVVTTQALDWIPPS